MDPGCRRTAQSTRLGSVPTGAAATAASTGKGSAPPVREEMGGAYADALRSFP